MNEAGEFVLASVSSHPQVPGVQGGMPRLPIARSSVELKKS